MNKDLEEVRERGIQVCGESQDQGNGPSKGPEAVRCLQVQSTGGGGGEPSSRVRGQRGRPWRASRMGTRGTEGRRWPQVQQRGLR